MPPAYRTILVRIANSYHFGADSLARVLPAGSACGRTALGQTRKGAIEHGQSVRKGHPVKAARVRGPAYAVRIALTNAPDKGLTNIFLTFRLVPVS